MTTGSGNVGWGAARTLSDEQRREDGVNLVLRSGETRLFVIVGEPYSQYVHWINSKPETCTGSKLKCPHCVRGSRRKTQFNVLVYVVEDKRLKILCGGTTLERPLSDLHDKLNGFADSVIELRRFGELLETEYTAREIEKISPELQQTISQLRLPSLADVVNRTTDDLGDLAVNDAPAPATDYFGTTTAPGRISDDVAAQMIARLKPQPAEAVAAFLRRFGATRVRDLRASDEPTALALIAEMESGTSTQQTTVEIDPFA